MGQIRKRRTFYRIRYYRRGQLIAGTTEHYEMGGRANAPAETGGRHCGRRPDHRPVERLTFDDAVEDVTRDYTPRRPFDRRAATRAAGLRSARASR